jgi:hypothetical protein
VPSRFVISKNSASPTPRRAAIGSRIRDLASGGLAECYCHKSILLKNSPGLFRSSASSLRRSCSFEGCDLKSLLRRQMPPDLRCESKLILNQSEGRYILSCERGYLLVDRKACLRIRAVTRSRRRFILAESFAFSLRRHRAFYFLADDSAQAADALAICLLTRISGSRSRGGSLISNLATSYYAIA